MKIVQLTKYDSRAASTRQRFTQYVPSLEAAGFSVENWPLLGNEYLDNLYGGRPIQHSYVVARYMDRAARILREGGLADVCWIHCDLLPFVPSFVEHALLSRCRHVVFDYDDAIFHNYDAHANPLVRMFLGKKLRGVLSRADMAFCGSPYLQRYASRYCGSSQLVPTVLDVDLYQPVPSLRPTADLRIGWIGTPSTWTAYMAPMAPLLAEVAADHGANILAIGAGTATSDSPHIESIAWSEEREVRDIQRMAIGVMPLDDALWTQGKCGYKLIQYMACGLPVVASPVGVNKDIVEHGVNGFLAGDEREWREALTRLATDPDLRRRMGAAGRAKVEREYSVQAWGPRVAEMMVATARGSDARI